MIPRTLNGHPVRAIAAGPGDTIRVLVQAPSHMLHPWVLALWGPYTGDEWTGGHYFKDRQGAEAFALTEFKVGFNHWIDLTRGVGVRN